MAPDLKRESRSKHQILVHTDTEAENRFRGFPPLKRFKILEKERREFLLSQKQEALIRGSVCNLPAKKRVCAPKMLSLPLNHEKREDEGDDDGDEKEDKENRFASKPQKAMFAAVLQPLSNIPVQQNLVSKDSLQVHKRGEGHRAMQQVGCPVKCGKNYGFRGNEDRACHSDDRACQMYDEKRQRGREECVKTSKGCEEKLHMEMASIKEAELIKGDGVCQMNEVVDKTTCHASTRASKNCGSTMPMNVAITKKVESMAEVVEECNQHDNNDADNTDDDDDDIFCDVCKGSDAEPSDPIVFCDGCNVMVHASCYGSPLIDGIPEGDWFCKQCESKDKERSRICCLCPSRSGAMKKTTNGFWAHLSCALFVPEVYYKKAKDKEGIECGRVPTWRFHMQCGVCGSNDGACIQCTEVGCNTTFHVSCALDRGLSIHYRNANALTKTPAIVIAFCSLHSRQALSRSERRRFKIVPRDQ